MAEGHTAAAHVHRLQRCHDCDGQGWAEWSDSPCMDCDGRGYLRPEFCALCGEPMGNSRRWWKAQGRPAAWDQIGAWFSRRRRP